MMAVLDFLAAFLVTSAAPVTVALPAPPAPMIISPRYQNTDLATGATTDVIAVQVRADGRMLWAGDMVKASNGMATYSQRLEESRACPNNLNRYGYFGRNPSTALTVTLSNSDRSDDTFPVQVEWTRTAPQDQAPESCQAAPTLTVRVQSNLHLPKGEPVMLKGDGGLSVVLTRR